MKRFEEFVAESRTFGDKIEWPHEFRSREAMNVIKRLFGFASRQPDSQDMKNLSVSKMDADAMLSWIEEFIDVVPGDDLSIQLFGTVTRTTTRAGTRYGIPLMVENSISGRQAKVILFVATRDDRTVDDFDVERM